MIILGIETSCDETGLSLYNTKKKSFINKLYSQCKLHNKYGGIIPEIASKYHAKKIFPLLIDILKQNKLKLHNINLIAYTIGPGLPNSLLMGVTLSKIISFLYNIPTIAINHIEAHIMSIMLNKVFPKFPFISLITSGANTILCIIYNYNKFKIIGECLDDSAGEIFDKIAILIKLKLPGGHEISKLAKYGKINLNFPKPLNYKNNFNFSFSGLKTHIFNYIKSNKLTFQTKANIAYSLEETITDILIKKIINASNKYKINNISIVGGVSRNKKLRHKINYYKKYNKNIFFPKINLCTDNATMIAYTGYLNYKNKYNKNFNNIKKSLLIDIKPKLKLTNK